MGLVPSESDKENVPSKQLQGAKHDQWQQTPTSAEEKQGQPDFVERAGIRTGEVVGEAVGLVGKATSTVGGAISSVVEGLQERLGLKKSSAAQESPEQDSGKTTEAAQSAGVHLAANMLKEILARSDSIAEIYDRPAGQMTGEAQQESASLGTAGKEEFWQAAESGEKLQEGEQPTTEGGTQVAGGPQGKETFAQGAESGEKLQEGGQPTKPTGKHGGSQPEMENKEGYAQAAESGEKIQERLPSEQGIPSHQTLSGPAWEMQGTGAQQTEGDEHLSAPAGKAGQTLTGPEWSAQAGQETKEEAQKTEGARMGQGKSEHETAGAAVEAGKDTVQSAIDAGEQAAGIVTGTVGEAAQTAQDTAGQAWDAARDTVGQAAQTAKDTASQVSARAFVRVLLFM